MRHSIAVAVLAISATCFAGPRDFIAEHAGAGANAQNAQPYIDQFLRLVESMVGWPANSAQGFWVDDEKAAEQAIAEHKPGFGMLDPEVYFALRSKYPMQPIAEVRGKTFNKGHYSLVVKNPAYKSLVDLEGKGKKLISNHLSSVIYVNKIAFGGKVDLAQAFTLEKTAQPSKPIKAVARGQADVALIDDEQLAQMKELAPELKVIWTSPPLPPTPVVAFTKLSKPADRAAFAKVLPKLCASAKGKAICESMFIDTFVPVDKAIYTAATKRYDK